MAIVPSRSYAIPQFRRFWRFRDAAEHASFVARYSTGVQAAPQIRTVASLALRTLRSLAGGDGTFDCVHMRRRDFVADHTEEESIDSYAVRAAKRLKRHGRGYGSSVDAPSAVKALFLASDVAEEPATQAAFRRAFDGARVFTLMQVFPQSQLDSFTSTPQLASLQGGERSAALAREMRLGNVDQLICSAAVRPEIFNTLRLRSRKPCRACTHCSERLVASQCTACWLPRCARACRRKLTVRVRA